MPCKALRRPIMWAEDIARAKVLGQGTASGKKRKEAWPETR